MNRNALKEIRSFGFSDEELRRDFQISDQTIRNYSAKSKRKKEIRISAPLIKLEMLSYILKTMKVKFPQLNAKVELKFLKVEGEPIVQFVNSHAKPKYKNEELIQKILNLSIESQLREKTIARAVDRFKSKYEYINLDTLETASMEAPDLVEGIVVDDKLTPLVRSYAIFALAQTHNDNYFSLIRAFVQHESPLMRESAYLGLFEYYDKEEKKHLELVNLFKKMLETERAPGVRQRIASLLGDMES